MWTLFAVAGAVPELLVPLVAGVIALAAVERPAVARGPNRLIDGALVACLLAIAFQLIPVAPSVRLSLSPSAVSVDRGLLLTMPPDPRTGPWQPLSIDPAATFGAFVTGVTLVVLFWCARAIVGRAMRTVVRAVAWSGLALAVFAMLQHATAPNLMYWLWAPPSRGSTIFGPFVNRNHLASWVIMAIPLTLGYIVARVRAREQRHRNAVDIAPALDAPMVWLAAAACLMVGALFVSLSRSGALGLMAGAGTLLWVSRQRMDRRGRRWLLAGIASVLIVASAYLSAHGFALRLDQTAREGLGSRAMIWNETWPMLRDFWLTGVGFGGYGRGMLVYQQTTREIFFNHAHNGYLQLAVEGGVLVGVPAVIAIVAGVWQLARRLRADHSPMFWIRAGAFSGLVAIAVQSIWEVGLVLPANAVLFAVLAAIAVHEP